MGTSFDMMFPFLLMELVMETKAKIAVGIMCIVGWSIIVYGFYSFSPASTIIKQYTYETKVKSVVRTNMGKSNVIMEDGAVLTLGACSFDNIEGTEIKISKKIYTDNVRKIILPESYSLLVELCK
ncbi:hypothetical protein KNT64_gp080 [Pseudomonas phage PspYZU05]|uniref:Uncharacterized protein n=1 Tax=Pseudomonas phage PspYZU05 TaxID=1983556 RepID=A0A2U7NRZ0_9CAUD|nr:hypothetical protein KNT64_gp080 [Pseudomonas phage PspYZU05]ASD52032.1 hypothetical protein PspYZU05_80 [Pseudomonas phage PspYZU05]